MNTEELDMNQQVSDIKPSTKEVNGRLWGARARDWADIQEGGCRAVFDAVVKKLNLNETSLLLDVGCGAGKATQLAAAQNARVSGLDASADLLEIAKSRVPKGDFMVGDIESLPYENGTFDVVTGYNSFQYAGNPIVALKEARRVAKQGATIVIVTWGEPQNMEAAALVGSLRPLLPPPPKGAPGPFALSDEAALRSFVTQAGLEPVEVFDVDSPWHYADIETALRGLRSSGVARKAIENTSQSAVDEAHTEALLPYQQPDGSFMIGACFRCVIAKV
jgi:SAM-dependent methyltransferase